MVLAVVSRSAADGLARHHKGSTLARHLDSVNAHDIAGLTATMRASYKPMQLD